MAPLIESARNQPTVEVESVAACRQYRQVSSPTKPSVARDLPLCSVVGLPKEGLCHKETAKLYAFKPQPHRFFCFFVKGKRIFIVSAYQKQGDKIPLQEIRWAENLRIECMQRIARKEERNEKK